MIDWAATVFPNVMKDMRGLAWGRLYEEHHNTPYDAAKVDERVKALYADQAVTDKNGIFEYVLGAGTDKSLLAVRLFDEATKQAVYAEQTAAAKAADVSNCSHCALGSTANKAKIWRIGEMDADHVAAWSKGGATSKENCEMLCITHNRAKGYR